MPLLRVTLPEELPPVTPEASALIVDAQKRIDAFIEERLSDTLHSFVPSDFGLVYAALRQVADMHRAPGTMFCEWGSGAGVATCLAAMVGFEACGLEVEQELVELSRRLARDHRVHAAFCRGNFVPRAGQRIAEQVGEMEWLAVGGPDAHEEMDLEIDDFDLVFAYPWPGEEHVVERLFERFAANGALLMTYNGAEGIRLFRKRRQGSGADGAGYR